MSALQRLQEFRFKKMQEAAAGNKKMGSPSDATPRTSYSNGTSKSNSNSNSNTSSSSSSRSMSKEPPTTVLDLSDVESESDLDLRQGVKKMTTSSPLRGSPAPSTSSDRQPNNNRSLPTTLKQTGFSPVQKSASTSGTPSKSPFKKLVTSFRYTGNGALPVPSDSDQSLSSPQQSEDDGDFPMAEDHDSRDKHKGNHSALKSSPVKRVIISSDEEEEIKPKRRLVRKGDLGRDTAVELQKRRRLMKRLPQDSEDESGQTSRSGSNSVSIQISDDESNDTEAFDRKLAQLQTTFPDAAFDDLTKALTESGGDFASAASLVLTRSAPNLLDLTSDSTTESFAKVPANKVNRFFQRPAKVTTSSSASAKDKKPARRDDESEDSFDEYGKGNIYRDQDRKEERALQFFNEATMLELQELSGCSKTQATGVIELRPFNNYDHLCVTLRKTKGVGEKIVDSYLTTTDAIRAVDQMLKTVDRVREDLVNILSVWCGDENGKLFQNSTSSNSMKISEERVSRESSVNGDDDDNPEPGMELVNFDADKVEQTEAGKKAMKGFIRKQPVNMAPGFQLKGYQLLGINWLALLWRKGLSGILADEMGLGKTAQVITFLAHLFEEGEEGPFLIIVPSSTLSNWMREFEKFCPSLDVRSYYGTQAEREELRYELEEDRTYNVLVTTYAMATGNNDERKFLSRQGFRGVILDEGHMLKNCASARYKQLMSIKTNFRLLLTGTPLQNNLQELLSLLIFIMPKLFAEHEEVLRTMFKVKVDASSEKSTLLSQERIVRARQMIAPFVLRRKKIHVLNDLPRKVERVIYCDLHPDQRVLYDRIMSSSALQAVLRDSTDDLIDPVELDSMDPKAKAKALAAAKKGASKKMTATAKKTAGEFANILMQLRKASDHPMLFRELYTDDKIKEMAKVITKEVEFCDSNIDYIEEDMSVMTDFELHRLCKQYKSVNRFALPGDQWMHAGKVKELERLLPKLIKKDKSRILIFSQFTMVLDILEAILKTMDIVYLRMDGSTKVEERQPLIDTFNDDSSYKVFLLSTKAGGFGINLTGANVVIMYDLDYNPHNDKQAEDRAHRVGQTREVQVIKLVSKNTIEDQIYQLANLKLKLDQHVSQDDTVNDASTKSESSSSSSTPSAGILSLIKKNWKETHNAYVANQQDQQDSAAVTTSISTSNTTVTSMSVTTTATPAKENMKLAATDGSENKAKAVKRSGISRSPSLSSVSSLSSSNSL